MVIDLPASGDDGKETSQAGDRADIPERLPRVSMHHYQIAGLQRNVAFRAPLAFEIFFDIDPHRAAVPIRVLAENLDRGFFSGIGESSRLGDGVEQSHRSRHDDYPRATDFPEHADLGARGLDQLDDDLRIFQVLA